MATQLSCHSIYFWNLAKKYILKTVQPRFAN